MTSDELKGGLYALAEQYEQGLERGDIDAAVDFLTYTEGITEQDIEGIVEALEQDSLSDDLRELARGVVLVYRWAPLLLAV